MREMQPNTDNQKQRTLWWELFAAVLAVLLLAYLALGGAFPRRRVHWLRVLCGANLHTLGKALHNYSTELGSQYPVADRWCDLLVKYADFPDKAFICRVALAGTRQTRSHYAMNPNTEPNSLAELVPLFEGKCGWNQYAGAEPLPPKTYHGEGEGVNVLFNSGKVKSIRSEELAELKSEGKDPNSRAKVAASANFRTPANDGELLYWLKNMVWIHGFAHQEITAATGLSESEIVASLKRFDIRPDNRIELYKGLPLYAWPYPGGRHPRIGFLEGAIDPQRETKFSVVTLWDRDGYVVVDLPEAVWSNLGLTYLAHTHIDTIWTKQGITLERLEWNRHPDGPLDIERKLPNGIVFRASVKPIKEAVHMELRLTNGTDRKLSDLRVQICVLTKMAKGFEQQTNDNKVFTNPYVACRSADGSRWIITAWENCHNPWGNEKCPCFHSDPKFPDIEPGRTARLRGWLSFYEGTHIETEFKRIEETGWRK